MTYIKLNIKMKTIIVLIGAMMFFSCQKREEIRELPSNTSKASSGKEITFYNQNGKQTAPKHEKGAVLFKLKDNSALKRVAGRVATERIFTKAMERVGDRGFHKGRFQDEHKALADLRKNPDVEWASFNYAEVTQTIDDPYWASGDLWGMLHINMPQVWQSGNFGNKNVVVGVIDEGIFGHDDLCVNIWKNPHELDNGIDDDGNGYIDDFNGWDWFNNDNLVYPGARHGTHVAGTIGAKGSNQMGVVGVASNVTLISCKFLEGWGFDENAVKAIDYLIDLKTRHNINIKVASNSWGGGGFNPGLFEAIQRARDADILFVAAAGNHNGNNDIAPNYPSGYDVDNIISVGASDWSNNKASFSCFGATTVDIFAPGTGIISTVPTDQHTSGYAFFSGTSMATPHVSGAAALYAGVNPEANYLTIKNAILNSASKLPQLKGLCLGDEIGGNFLNVASFTGQTAESQAPFYPCPELNPDRIPPTTPQNLDVYEVGFDPTEGAFYGGYFGVRWNPSTDAESGVVGYVVYFNDVAEWFVTGTHYVFAGFLDTTENIVVKVYALDAWGNASSFSNSDTAIWNGSPDTEPPTNPSNLLVTNPTLNSLSLNWAASTDNVSVAAYDVYRNGVKVLSTTNTFITDQSLNSGATYNYFVRARDAAGNVSGNSNSASGTTLSPEPPPACTPSANLGANQSAMTVNLNWSIAGDCMIDVTRLERKKGDNGTFTTIATNPANPYVDTCPSPGFYVYRLAIVTGGQTTYSNEVRVKASKR
jgi:subtilisin family serine protease